MSRPNQYSSEKRRKELEKKRKKEEKLLRRAEAKSALRHGEDQPETDESQDGVPESGEGGDTSQV